MANGVRLFVRSLPIDLIESNLHKQFSLYGNVNNIEIKAKKGLDDGLNKFAFVTLDTDNYNINKCIQDFSQNEFQGMYLDVSIAKESFMERLKRERSEALNKQAEKNKSFNSHQNDEEDYSFVAKYKPDSLEVYTFDNKTQLKNNQTEIIPQFQKNLSNNERTVPFKIHEEKITQSNNQVIKNETIPSKQYEAVKVNRFKRKWNDDEEIIVPIEKSSKTVKTEVKISSMVNQVDKTLTPSDIKRIESIQHMRMAYNEKKSLIKSALSNVDKKVNNKIIFDDDYKISKTNSTKNPNNEKASKEKQFPKHKNKLFIEESDDDNEYNFDVKEKYHGESGRKLMELQSRYQSDKRFVLDERFLENDDNDIEAPSDVIESIEDNEKARQMQILQSVLGTVPNSTDTVKKGQIKTMLRYDPTRVDHMKYINTPAEKPKEKKDKKKSAADVERIEVIPAPEVSKERYYKVDESLKKSMEEKKPFSLLSLFGQKDEEKADSEEYASIAIEKPDKKIKNPAKSKDNPFYYDSSESEDDTKTKVNQVENFNKIENGPVTISENLFFTSDDSRLKEGLEFFMNKSLACNQPRDRLKFIVKKRIQNNIRNDKFHAKKSMHRNINTKPFKKR